MYGRDPISVNFGFVVAQIWEVTRISSSAWADPPSRLEKFVAYLGNAPEDAPSAGEKERRGSLVQPIFLWNEKKIPNFHSGMRGNCYYNYGYWVILTDPLLEGTNLIQTKQFSSLLQEEEKKSNTKGRLPQDVGKFYENESYYWGLVHCLGERRGEIWRDRERNTVEIMTEKRGMCKTYRTKIEQSKEDRKWKLY